MIVFNFLSEIRIKPKHFLLRFVNSLAGVYGVSKIGTKIL